MLSLISIILFLATAFAAPSNKKIIRSTQVPSRNYDITTNVLHLDVVPNDQLDAHLARFPVTNVDAQDFSERLSGASDADPNANATTSTSIITVGGRTYMTNVTLGQSNIILVLDTGSSDTWAIRPDFSCDGSPYPNCGFGSAFTPSAYFAPVDNRSFSVQYTDGEYLNGILATDIINIGGLVVNQTIGAVDSGYWLGDRTSSGLMGLAYPALTSNSDLGYSSIMWTLIDQGLMPPVFSMAINRYSSTNPSYGGVLALGGLPPGTSESITWATAPLQMVGTDVFTFYTITVEGFAIAAPAIPLSKRQNPPSLPLPPPRPTWTEKGPLTQNQQLIVDSGTTLMYLADDLVDHIASLFYPPAQYSDAYNLYLVNCTAIPPRFAVVIDGQSLYVNPLDMISQASNTICIPSIQRQGQGSAVLGDSWMKNVLAVFDLGNSAVRFTGREIY